MGERWFRRRRRTVRILPLGDSITPGRTSHWSYRRDLEAALNDAGCSFDFVGTLSGPGSAPGAPLVDRDHEGHSGFRTDQIRARINNWLPGNGHDWALIHVGTNDVLQGTSIAGRAHQHLADHRPVAQRQPNGRDPAGAGHPEPARRTKPRSWH